MIKGILIDIDNTLYDYGKSHSLAINAAEDAVKSFVNIDKFKKHTKKHGIMFIEILNLRLHRITDCYIFKKHWNC